MMVSDPWTTASYGVEPGSIELERKKRRGWIVVKQQHKTSKIAHITDSDMKGNLINSTNTETNAAVLTHSIHPSIHSGKGQAKTRNTL